MSDTETAVRGVLALLGVIYLLDLVLRRANIRIPFSRAAMRREAQHRHDVAAYNDGLVKLLASFESLLLVPGPSADQQAEIARVRAALTVALARAVPPG